MKLIVAATVLLAISCGQSNKESRPFHAWEIVSVKDDPFSEAIIGSQCDYSVSSLSEFSEKHTCQQFLRDKSDTKNKGIYYCSQNADCNSVIHTEPGIYIDD